MLIVITFLILKINQNLFLSKSASLYQFYAWPLHWFIPFISSWCMLSYLWHFSYNFSWQCGTVDFNYPSSPTETSLLSQVISATQVFERWQIWTMLILWINKNPESNSCSYKALPSHKASATIIHSQQKCKILKPHWQHSRAFSTPTAYMSGMQFSKLLSHP